jgi:putative hydrolase of the HAD superfamily
MFDPIITHVSFDAWNTVLLPNPVYADKRSKLLAAMYSLSVTDARRAYTSVKKHFDGLAETSGVGFPVQHVCDTLDHKLTGRERKGHATGLQTALEQAFFENPPTVLPELVSALMRITQSGRTIGILSNTNFISGQVLRTAVFDKLDLQFTTLLFSDEHRMSKPNPAFYAKMAAAAQAGNKHVTGPANILHIGDMARTDGAAPPPMQHLLIENPAHLVAKLKETCHA